MWPDLRLLADNIEVGVGAQEAFKLLYPGIQKKKDYSPLSDRKTVLKELLEHITCNVDVIPRMDRILHHFLQKKHWKIKKKKPPGDF